MAISTELAVPGIGVVVMVIRPAIFRIDSTPSERIGHSVRRLAIYSPDLAFLSPANGTSYSRLSTWLIRGLVRAPSTRSASLE